MDKTKLRNGRKFCSQYWVLWQMYAQQNLCENSAISQFPFCNIVDVGQHSAMLTVHSQSQHIENFRQRTVYDVVHCYCS